MNDQEIRLRCLELAINQLKAERKDHDREAVADLQMWFYNRTKPESDAPAQPAARKGKGADKSPEIFG